MRSYVDASSISQSSNICEAPVLSDGVLNPLGTSSLIGGDTEYILESVTKA